MPTEQVLHISASLFTEIARITGVLTVLLIFVLVFYDLSFYAVMAFILWISLLYLLRTFVNEPLVDERVIEIQRMATTRAAQAFVIILMVAILLGPLWVVDKGILITLEVVLGVFIFLKLITTRFYERTT